MGDRPIICNFKIMNIDIRISIDKGTGDPFWDGRLVQGEHIVYQAVSKTFHPEAEKEVFERRLQAVCDTIIKRIVEHNDQAGIRSALLNQGS